VPEDQEINLEKQEEKTQQEAQEEIIKKEPNIKDEVQVAVVDTDV